jgi:hypothetical protein
MSGKSHLALLLAGGEHVRLSQMTKLSIAPSARCASRQAGVPSVWPCWKPQDAD